MPTDTVVPRWTEQWKRVQRGYSDLVDLAIGRPAEHLDEERAFELLRAFFIECYQLKDWLKNDPSFCSDQSPPNP
jgi:hypothetical protein